MENKFNSGIMNIVKCDKCNNNNSNNYIHYIDEIIVCLPCLLGLTKTQKDRIKLLEKVISAKDEILVAYRLGKKPSDNALDLLQKFKEV